MCLLFGPQYTQLTNHLSYGDVEIAAGNVLDIFAMIDPSKMTLKLKLHLLARLCADILHFGPLVGVATEAFECFNAIFRFCSIHSNHLAPSRDISWQLAGQESLKHCVTGGWWSSGGNWVRSGSLVRDFLQTQPMLQGLLGWQDPKPLIQGELKLSMHYHYSHYQTQDHSNSRQ
jgi:hypothetical protein